MNCLVCTQKLQPSTNVTRCSGEDTSVGWIRKQHDETKAKRAEQIAAGKVGLYGEAEFCTQSCAIYFARAAVTLLKQTRLSPEMVANHARKIFPALDRRVAKLTARTK